MSRWQANPKQRLEQAALDLFIEQGFAETTVPEITARAGLTKRTFFRHFTDKREVLFTHEEQLTPIVASLMAGAPASFSPLRLIKLALETVAVTRFEVQFEYLHRRRVIVQSDEGLRERETRRQSILSEAISRGFVDRGVDELSAILAAQIAVSVLNVSVDRWLDEEGKRPLSDVIRGSLVTLQSVLAEPA